MPSTLVWPFIFVILGICTALFDPLRSIGDGIGPGWSDVLNGGLVFVFLILAGVSGLLAMRRARST